MDNYKNCPLKKRPVLYVEAEISAPLVDEQPQDLSIKREADDGATQNLSTTYNSAKRNIYSGPKHPNSIAKETSIPRNMDFQNIHHRGVNSNTYTNGFGPFNLMTAGWNNFGLPSASTVFSGLLTPPTSPSSCSITSELHSPRSDIYPHHSEIPSPNTTKISRFECDKCVKVYSTSAGLTKHQQFHCPAADCNKERKQHSCEECGKAYTTKGALKMHIKTHTLPCKCPICEKAFSRPWLLQGHMRTHTGEKPYSCTECNRSFADRSNLRAHQQTHIDVKKYSCNVCSKTFSRMSLLNKHSSNVCPAIVA